MLEGLFLLEEALQEKRGSLVALVCGFRGASPSVHRLCLLFGVTT